jgi:hypothetical protein
MNCLIFIIRSSPMGPDAANVTELSEDLIVTARSSSNALLQMIFRLSPDTEGRNGDSLSADRRSEFEFIFILPPLATATAAKTLAASLRPFFFICVPIPSMFFIHFTPPSRPIRIR